MLTPKEKANKLVDVFRMFADGIEQEIDRFSPKICKENAKQCALITVNEIIESRKADPDFDDTKLVTHYIAPHPLRLSYWTKVKEEIEKL